MKFRNKIILLIIIKLLIVVYFISYYNIMDVEVRARDDDRFGKPSSQCFSSSAKNLPKYFDRFTLADGSVVIMEYREVSLWNYIFCPADVVRIIIHKYL